ncbi:MFS transporter [Yoonia vestfoldensis]|uniref:MFS transporter n=1 Tax=Yoonia vestfoldensis TaxID=245188 RepID=UPI000476AA24|nr:MFS transporter [Yoonia vestfoldensis]
MTTQTAEKWHGAGVALVCGALILLISLGVRHAFGLFLQPVSMDQGWGRETFAFAIALQNLVWGVSQPFTGMLSDRFGAKPIVATGAVLYGAGLWTMSVVGGEAVFILGAGVLIGLGLSGTTFPVIFAAISRLVAPERRSLAMGITMSVGSFGQFAMLPVSLGLIIAFEWQTALVVLSILALAIFPLAFGIRSVPAPVASADEDVPFGQALRDAFGQRDFWLLSLGFFACGFQVVFISVHLPAFLADEGVGNGIATIVLALIGLVNIAGTYYAGLWGGRHRKPMLLSWIYLGRAAAIAAFVLLPVTAASAYIFGAVMGLFWLSTVPLTNGTVAAVFGIKHMSMLAGIVFFAHQLGSFAGGWMGGWLYDRSGSYDIAWGIAIGLSILAAVLNWPITERTLAQRRAVS